MIRAGSGQANGPWRITIATLAGATHHSLPYADADELGRQVLGFLHAGLPGGTS